MVKKITTILWFWVPVFLWMAMIFYFSSVKDEDLLKIDIPFADKLFHFIEYFILSALLARAFSNSVTNPNFKYILIVSILIASIYGGSDEFHQRFVPGRASDIFDLLSDVIGSGAGAMLLVYKERIGRAVNKTL